MILSEEKPTSGSISFHSEKINKLNSKKLIDFMDKEDVTTNGYNESIKMKFALTQFVNAFLEFERLEEKYPAVMKFM
jgi:hypothetical protein